MSIKEFEMSQEQLDQLKAACKPVPMIALNCGTPSSPQANANAAWKRLGDEMGFDHMTVEPNGKGQRFFSAQEVNYNPQHCVGENCKAINGIGHSVECEAAHEAIYAKIRETS